MPAFRRVFNADPGSAVLAEIEAVVIVDIAPPPSLVGAGTGTVLLVGEFERGSLTATEVFGGQDLVTQFGGLGRVTETSIHDGAVALKSGGDELWNGNGFIWLRNKAFSRLLIQRVDTSAGEVTFTRLACLLSSSVGTVAATTGDVITFRGADGTDRSSTLTVTAATLLASGATYPQTLTGQTLIVTNDDNSPRIVTFTAAESVLADYIAKINGALALDLGSDVAGELQMVSETIGRAGFIKCEGTAAAALGFNATGALVAEVVSLEFVVTVPAVGTYTLRIGVLERVSTLFDETIAFTTVPTATEIRDAFFDAFSARNIPFVTLTKVAGANPEIDITYDLNVFSTGTAIVAEPSAGDVVLTTTPAVVNAAYGTGPVQDSARITLTEAASFIDAIAGLDSDVTAAGQLRVCADSSIGVGITHTLQAIASALAIPWGFDLSVLADASDGADVTVPAGTRVRGPNSTWSTLQDFSTGSGRGPFTAKIRPFSDDDTAVTDASGTITTVVDSLGDVFEVTNAADAVRLSAVGLEVAYRAAFAKTVDVNTVAREANIVASARASAGILTILSDNADLATSSGLRARKAIGRPTLGTDRLTMKGDAGVGVGANRNQRLFYCGVGFTTFIPEIQEVGAVQGPGFTDNGVIEVGGDGFYANVRSILPPEENAGQFLGDTNVGSLNVLSLEDFYNPEVGGINLTIQDYTSFRREGIIVPRFTREFDWAFQSDVTSVDGVLDSNVADASRRFMADFIIDTYGDLAARYVKKLGSPNRRRALLLTTSSFMDGLVSPNNPDLARIDSFSQRETSTQTQREAGFMLVSVKAKTFPALLAIQFTIEVGTTVVIEET